MSVATIVVLLSSLIVQTVAAHQLVGQNGTTKITKLAKRYESNFDILIERLSSISWGEDEKICLDQILDTIHNAKNATLWATWVWDSMQLPAGQLFGSRYHLGNYDQCLREKVAASRPPFPTQYCVANVLLQATSKITSLPDSLDPFGSADEYIRSKTGLLQRFNEMDWGVCLPRVCKPKSVEAFARVLLKQSHLGHLSSPHKMTIRCEVPGQPDENADGINVLLKGALLVTLIVVTCTVYLSQKRTENPPSFADSVLRCLCLKRNAKELMQRNENDVNVLHGMRFISSAVIVLIHVVFAMLFVTVGNGLDFEEHLNSYGIKILNFVIAVDTFFFMSGLLFMRNIKNNTTIRSLVETLIKRYFRLIWWYIANILIIFFVLPSSGCGPVCPKFAKPELESCYKTWWSGMLMVGNYHNVHRVCAPVAWYIFCDFQLAVVSAVLFWIYQKQKRVGIICFAILTTLSILIPGWFVYTVPELGIVTFDFDMYWTMRDPIIRTPKMSLYGKTHHRASPYLIGVIMGYIMANYNEKDLRSFFTKKRIIKGFLMSTGMIVILLVAYENGSESLKSALLLALHRPIWALFLSAVVGLCEYGRFPLVNDFLSWRAFAPLSKLTYGIYMIHCTIIMVNTACTRSPLYFNAGILAEKFLGNLVLAAFASLFFMLFVESPLNNLVKLMLARCDNSKQKAVQNGGDEISTNRTNSDTMQSDHKHKKL
ncbi:unnamed protein product, partial [Iphiclides podalirius]